MYLRKDFNSYDHSFCESKLWDGSSEYINSLTSLFISYIGYYGLKYNHHLNNDVFLLYSALLINGICSFLYHWTNYLGWGYFDRFSMVLIAYPCVVGGLKEISYLYKFDNKINKFMTVLTQIYFTFLITFCALDYEKIFNNLFGIFLGLILVFMIMVNFKRNEIDKKIHKLINWGFIGVSMIAIAGISWIIIENLCDVYSIMKYTHGHAIWHIFVSLGGYLSSLLLVGLSISRNEVLPFYYIISKKKN